MAQSYTRQSTFADGDTVTAALFNDEYNQLLNAFAYSNTSEASTGHRHDGTAGEGGNIHTIGDLDFNNKIVVDSTNNRWGFYVEVSSAAVEQIRIQDGAMIPVTDSDIDLGTSSLYWKDAYIDSVTTTGNIAIGGNLTVTGNATISGNLTFGDADTDSITLTADVASSITPDTDDTYDLGSASKEWRNLYIDGTANIDSLVADTADINAGTIDNTTIGGTTAAAGTFSSLVATTADINAGAIDNTTIGATTASTGNFSTLSIGGVAITSTSAELNILDGVTATATEINIMDGDTAATPTTLADADRVVVNDAGTMKQVALTDFETYFETSLDTLSNVTTVGALNSGSITSGFGAIDTGSSNITTTGTVSFGSLTDGAITITAFVDEDNMASDSATLVPTQQSVKAYVDTQIGGLSSSLSGLSDTNITSPADGALLFYDTGTSTWIDNVVSGDITIADTGVAAISSGVIVNDDINASAAISVSKTALVDGTGLTLTGDTLSVDASQTQITAVGTIATGTWQGTAIADAYVADNLTISGGTVDNSVIGGTTAAAGTFTDLTASGTLTLGGTAITSTATELNYTDGVTSNIQTQLDSKVGASYTGDVDITGELLVDSYNETFKKVSSVSTVNGYQISSASYDSISFSITTEATAVVGLAFNTDGTKMFVLDYPGEDVSEYTLSTAFNVSTASFVDSFSVATETFTPSAIAFKSDGTKMFVVSRSGNSNDDRVFQYTLSTGFDVSTASYDSVSFVVSSQANNPEGVTFSSDGTKMYIADNDNDTIYQYSLSTAWDLSTASYASKSFSVASQETSARGVQFNSNGTKMFIVGFGSDNVYQYTLSTAFDVNTASYDSVSFSVFSQGSGPNDLAFSSDGTKMYIADSDNDTVYQYSTSTTTYSTTFDCENANVFETELDANTTVVFSNPPASGTPVVTSSYDLTVATAGSTLDVSSQEINPQGLFLKPDGTKAYVVGDTGDAVYQYDFTTAFDISTASYASKTFSVASQEGQPTGLFFKSDGTKMYIVGQNTDAVYQYSLSTAWDVSTASYDSVSFSLTSQGTQPQDLTFSSDGTKMYTAENSADSIFQYTLSTAWDLSTASYASKSLDVSGEDATPVAIAFNNDGTELFVSGSTADDIFKYTLTTAYDVSTASYSSVSFAPATTNHMGIQFGDSGQKMYLLSVTSDDITEYSVATTNLVDSTAYAMSLKVVQDSGASGYTVTWPTSVDWPSATAPTLTATASAVDQFVFYTYDGGTTWYGFTAGQALG